MLGDPYGKREAFAAHPHYDIAVDRLAAKNDGDQLRSVVRQGLV